MKFVGLSLSFCVKHILEGRISEDQVAFIVPGFPWDGIVSESYYSIYWKPWEKAKVDELLSRLVIQGGRVGGHNVSQGIWWPLDQWDETVLDDYQKRLRTEELAAVMAGINAP